LGAAPESAQSAKRSSLLALLESEVALLNKAELDASGREEGDDGLLALSNDEHVAGAGSEMLTVGILDVGNVEAAGVLLDVLEHADTTDVVSTDDQYLSSVLVLNEALNFTTLKVQLYCSSVSI
jgi:hypothetical protein